MIFHACPQCGRWKNLSLSKALADAVARIRSDAYALVPSPNVVQCDVCGVPMAVIRADDRVTVRAATDDVGL